MPAGTVGRPPRSESMLVSIQFCAVCDYEPRALRLAAAVRKHIPDAKVELVPSGLGEFDVKCDGTLVFEKEKAGRLPEDAEVLEALMRRKSDEES
jgi:selT/selW/selH-like putative selenoprotein